MNELIAYLRANVILDFQGDLNLELVHQFIKNDESREARSLMTKLVADAGVNEMMLVLADCLVESVKASLTDAVFRENLRMYSES